MLGLSGVRTVWQVIQMDGTVTDGHPDGMARLSGRLKGNRNLRRAKSSESAMNSEIPIYSIFTHTSDFFQTQNEAKILTNSSFGHSGTKIT